MHGSYFIQCFDSIIGKNGHYGLMVILQLPLEQFPCPLLNNISPIKDSKIDPKWSLLLCFHL